MRRLTFDSLADRAASAGRITHADPNAGVVELALPAEMCTPTEGLTHLFTLLSTPAEYSYCDSLWLDSIELAPAMSGRLAGPAMGVADIRARLNVHGRPLLALVGRRPIDRQNEARFHTVCEQALEGGADLLCDDLLLVDPLGEYALKARVHKMCAIIRKCKARLKRPLGYIANIGMSPFRAIEQVEWLLQEGVFGVMLNSFTMGFGAIEEFRRIVNGRCAIICTNMGSGTLSRAGAAGTLVNQTGVSEAVFAKLSRLAGADAVHTGTSASECYGAEAWGPASRSLGATIPGIRPSLAVAEGDITVANLWDNIKSLGTDVIVEPTSGIINFPGGPEHGARAFRILMDRLRSGMSDAEAHSVIQTLALGDARLREGLTLFGYVPPKE